MFTPEQTKELAAPLNKAHVASRSQAGRNLSYIEAWWAISEANRIFGFDGWTRETVDLTEISPSREVDGKWRVGYRAKVRITVFPGIGDFGDTGLIREGCGFGSGIDKDLHQAHESALKEAESDAMKRALMTFGNPFGLALYDKTQANVTTAAPGKAAGGHARAESLSPERRTEIAKGAAEARWGPGVMTGTDLANQGRKSSAQAKRDGDDVKIKADIAKCDRAGLQDWHENLENYTAHLPLAWVEQVQNMLELRLEELNTPAEVTEAAAEMDEAFRGTMGGPSPGNVAGRGSQVAA